jgi:hypothetical protein
MILFSTFSGQMITLCNKLFEVLASRFLGPASPFLSS